MDMQALFPVYLPRYKQKEQPTEDYDSSVAQNENNLNQNFELLYRQLETLAQRVADLEV